LTARTLSLYAATDNPAGAFRLDELTETVRALERQRAGRTVDELSRAVFAELAVKRTRRSAELGTEAIRLARAREPHAEISGSRWQASTAEVRNRALNAGFETSADGSIPEQAITAYNQTHHRPPVLSRTHPKTGMPQRAAEEKSGNATYPVTFLTPS
jgi:hypothetical protein